MPNILSIGPVRKHRYYAANKVYEREKDNGRIDGNYRQFRRTILYDSLNDCFRYISAGFYIGIANDGYTHS
jgi:hypothetical protein